MAFKLKDLDGRLGEVIQSVTADKDMVLAYDGGDGAQIWREQGCVYVIALGIDIYSAITCIYNEDTQDYETDKDLFLLYKHGKTGSDNEIYNEWGRSLAACIHNYAHYIGRKDLTDMDAVYNLDCVYCLNWEKSLK